jgi:osmotically-inducible protein OsmY
MTFAETHHEDSGFAKSQAEKDAAESIARKVNGVKAVKTKSLSARQPEA